MKHGLQGYQHAESCPCEGAAARQECVAFVSVREALFKSATGSSCSASRYGASPGGCTRTTFKEACGSRDRLLRVRDDDPSDGVKASLTTPDRKKTIIFPREFEKLLACDDEKVDPDWKEAYAVLYYTYMRPEEAQAVTWRDFDLDTGFVSVSKAVDARTGEAEAATKD